MNASDVTFAVLNFNGRALLEQLLPTIFAQTAGGFDILVVDNGSTDDSATWLAAHHPAVWVVRLPENIGVTRALNVAVASCATPYVALLNNDIELTPTWLAEMRQALEDFPGAASADGKLLNFHRRGELDGAGDLIAVTGECSKRGFGQADAGQYDTPAPILCASGGAALYRTQAFADVGPFDATYGAYYEDTDWGLRAFLRGHSCR
ncbi:MAG: glycosyltransferase family 2 protein, partial [Solirubrobacteraceae bacterium]